MKTFSQNSTLIIQTKGNMNNHNEDQQQLVKIRHSAEHILTMAMHALYGPDRIIMAMGPATDDGFYFDFDQKNIAIVEDNFPTIEAKMKNLIALDLRFERLEVQPEIARALFANNPFKQEWINEAEGRGEIVSLYITAPVDRLADVRQMVQSGQHPPQDERIFVDVCKGPHVDSSLEIVAVKLLNLAGAYWRGSEKNPMLTRLYGTAYPSQAALDEYLVWLEEARKRDHRKLGKELDLFTFSELVGPGLPLWTPKGTMLRNLLDEFVWQLRREKGYQKVAIPHITKKDLYETSGHWKKFENELFRIKTREEHEFAMKPMNCPHHTQIYAHIPRSYRDLPQRYAETTMVYRDEQTGELSGLSRVRCITQDDAHVFCRESQVRNEAMAIWDIIEAFYKGTGFADLRLRLSLHDPAKMENYLGTQAEWEYAENQLREFVAEKNMPAVEAVGEAAFYGPKLDFMAYDSLGREWQVATIQIDRNMPERFGLTCISEEGNEERIVMIHAAIMGSIERFLSILIEHYAGAFPVWLSPVQVALIPISEDQMGYADTVARKLGEQGIRVEVRGEAETMQNRIRKAESEKIPYMLIVGGREAEAGTVSVRGRGQMNMGVMSVDEFVGRVVEEVKTKQI
jgi:threonyl-tRNA synthetase